jgi:hypothetical protein
VSCIAPKPSRRTGMSPLIKNVPLASAGRALGRREDRCSCDCIGVVHNFSFSIWMFGCDVKNCVAFVFTIEKW